MPPRPKLTHDSRDRLAEWRKRHERESPNTSVASANQEVEEAAAAYSIGVISKSEFGRYLLWQHSVLVAAAAAANAATETPGPLGVTTTLLSSSNEIATDVATLLAQRRRTATGGSRPPTKKLAKTTFSSAVFSKPMPKTQLPKPLSSPVQPLQDKSAASLQLTPPARTGAGFRNIGNTCYVGALLTLLLRSTLISNAIKLTANLADNALQETDVRLTARRPNFGLHDPLAAPTTTSAPATTETSPPPLPIPEFGRDDFLLHRKLRELCIGIETRTEVSPFGLHEAFTTFFDNQMHDAHEFLTILVDSLEVEAKKIQRTAKELNLSDTTTTTGVPTSGRWKPPAAECWTDQVLTSLIVAKVQCQNKRCEHHLNKIETIVTVTLPLDFNASQPSTNRVTSSVLIDEVQDGPGRPGSTSAAVKRGTAPPTSSTPLKAPTVQEIFDNQFAERPLEGYKCDRCHQEDGCTKTGALADGRTPPILLLNLMRYTSVFQDGVGCVLKHDGALRLSPVLLVKTYRFLEVPYAIAESQASPSVHGVAGVSPKVSRKRRRLPEVELERAISAVEDVIVRDSHGGQGEDMGEERGATSSPPHPTELKAVECSILLYQLCGIVIHHGSTPTSGHYIARVAQPMSDLQTEKIQSTRERLAQQFPDSREAYGLPSVHWIQCDDAWVTCPPIGPSGNPDEVCVNDKQSYVLRYDYVKVLETYTIERGL
jgi:ubiquitin C-terminal hydrolase